MGIPDIDGIRLIQKIELMSQGNLEFALLKIAEIDQLYEKLLKMYAVCDTF